MIWHKFRSLLGVMAILSIPFCAPATNNTKPVYSPQYMSYADLRSSYNYGSSEIIKKAGKIYHYGNYLFVNEIQKGVHVINVTNPSNPVNEGFINIPGNVDIAIKNNIMYADSFVDLIVIDITSPGNPVYVTRINDLFPYPYYYADNMAFENTGFYSIDPGVIFETIDTALGIVIGWVYSHEEEIAVVASAACDIFMSSPDILYSGGAPTSAESNTAITGTGGSLARFTIVNDGTNYYLYTLNHTDLNIVNITNETNPVWSSGQSFTVGWEIQSLAVDGNNLFISSALDIGIYSIGGTYGGSLTYPAYVSTYTHNMGCSPVVASGNYMYATVNANTASSSCYNYENFLQVIDITNLLSPVAKTAYYLTDPHGLGIDSANNILVVADGTAGLKLFDLSGTPFLIPIIANLPAPGGDPLHDIILSPPSAFVVGGTGIYIYDTSGITTGNMTLQGNVQIVP